MTLKSPVKLPIAAAFLFLVSSLVLAIPSSPSALVATTALPDRIDLTWTDTSNDEDGFQVYRSASALGPWTEVGKTTQDERRYTDTGLTPMTAYYYVVRATSSSGSSGFSNVAVARTTSGVAPSAPVDLAANAFGGNGIRLTWTDTSDDEEGFQIIRSTSVAPGQWYEIQKTQADTTSFTDTDVDGGTTYFYVVRSFSGDSSSTFSNMASALASTTDQAPVAPSDLSAIAISSTQINLAWSDNSDNEVGFRIERANSPSGPWSQIAVTGPGSRGFSNVLLTPGTTYSYRVIAFNAAGVSGASTVASATTASLSNPPSAPSALSASASSPTHIDLTWTDNSDDETGFRIEGWVSGGWVNIATVGANVTSFAHTSLTAATTYFYRVGAYNASGPSAASNVASATTPAVETAPLSPQSLVATATSSSQIALSWTDASSNEAGFAIERASSASGPFQPIATTTLPTYFNTGLTAATTYFYRVHAFNAVGSSGNSNVTSATTQAGIPSAPSGLAATATSSSQIALSWTDNSAGETGFIVERGTSASGPFSQVATTHAPSYADSALLASTTYYYRVRAFNGAGSSPYSNITSTTTMPSIPTGPTNLAATAVSSSRIDLTWRDNSNLETGYRLERATSASGLFAQIAILGANIAEYSDTGLEPSTSYSYRVRAQSVSGGSSYSNVATATTRPNGGEHTAPSTPASVTATDPICGAIRIAWSPSIDTGGSGLKGYNVYRRKIFLKFVAAPATSTLDTGLPSAAYYTYAITAVDNDGNESELSELSGSYTLSCAGAGGGYRWATEFGGPLVPDTGQAAAFDDDGNVYITGDFQGSTDFGGRTLTSVGYRDVFVAKYGPDGSPRWSRSFGGIFDDTGKAISVDKNGDVLVTGVFLKTADLGGDPLVSAGGYDVFVAKYSGSSGAHLWSMRVGGAADDRVTALTVDLRGDLTIGGQFKGVVDFGNGPVPNANVYAQGFLAKYQGTDGGFVWAKRLGQLSGSTTFGTVQSVASDTDGSILATGYYRGPVDFGGGALTSVQDLNIFLVKYTSTGAHLWSKSFGGADDQHGMGVAVDPLGNVVLAGDFLTAVDFGRGPLDDTESAQTIFLASFAPDGAHRWSKSFTAEGLNGASYMDGLAVDRSGNIIITGSIAGPVDLGGGPLPLSTVFVAKYTSSGDHTWSKSYRSNGGQGHGLAVDHDGHIALTGNFDLVIDVGGGEIRSAGGVGSDGFLAVLEP